VKGGINGCIVVADPKTFAVTTMPLTNGCAPSGLAVGPDQQELFVGCGVGGVQVVKISDGTQVPGSPITQPNSSGGCDEVWYNSGDNHYLGACNFPGGNAEIAIIDAGTGLSGVTADVPILTDVGAAPGGAPHSVAADSKTNEIVFPVVKGFSQCPGTGCIVVYAPVSKSE
jgi:streptogramin lyase